MHERVFEGVLVQESRGLFFHEFLFKKKKSYEIVRRVYIPQMNSREYHRRRHTQKMFVIMSFSTFYSNCDEIENIHQFSFRLCAIIINLRNMNHFSENFVHALLCENTKLIYMMKC